MRQSQFSNLRFLERLTILLLFFFESGGHFPLLLTKTSLRLQKNETKRKSTPAGETQAARKRVLKGYCLKHRFNKKPKDAELQFVIVDDEHKLMYCSIPKVASTTFKRVLADLRGLKQGIFVHRPSLWRRLREYDQDDRAFRLKTYFKFIFVREPLHRLLSAYKDKFIGKNRQFSNNIRKKIVKRLRPHDFHQNGDNNVSFTEFVQFHSRHMNRNPHWRQYEKLCHPCVLNYDFIGHLETLQQDVQLLLKMARVDGRVTFPPIHNATSLSDVLQYYSKVSSKYIARLGEIYSNDFEMFGYEFPGPLTSLLNQTFVESG